MRITHILFDLGGVLVELDGEPVKNEWLSNPEKPAQSWQTWLNSPLVKKFDRGLLAPTEFAHQIIKEQSLQTTPEEFLEWLAFWPKDFFPGALDLINSLKVDYTVGIFSNITSLHWPRYFAKLKGQDSVSHYFASYKMGLVKPDKEAFEFVIKTMRTRPKQILFLDDNIINVESARNCGLNAQCVKGITETRALLRRLKLVKYNPESLSFE